MSESRVTLPTSVPSLVFLGLSRLRPDVRDRQTDVIHASSLNASAQWGRGHNNDDDDGGDNADDYNNNNNFRFIRV